MHGLVAKKSMFVIWNQKVLKFKKVDLYMIILGDILFNCSYIPYNIDHVYAYICLRYAGSVCRRSPGVECNF